jgi:hypothetical protein
LNTALPLHFLIHRKTSQSMSRVVVKISLCFSIILLTLNLQATCISGNCSTGKGTFLFKDGSKYTGYFYNGKAHGQGTYYHKDGTLYTGAFVNGVKHGIGKLSFVSKEWYSGNFVNGVINGKGKMTYRNGDIYTGDWVNGKSSGTGKYIFADGDVYEGDFINGLFSGQGKLTRTDGSYYEGEWQNSKKNGEGFSFAKGKKMKVYYDNNTLLREETISNQAIVTAAKTEPNTTTKILDCNKEYCHNTLGSLRYKDGSVYTGDFVNGIGEGNGKCKYANGDRYEGGWKNHAPHGQGIMHFSKGTTYAAIWDNGVPKQKINPNMSPVIAQDTKPKPTQKSDNTTKIYALIAGVASYSHMPSLKYTDDDAYQLYAFLKSPEGGAIPDDHIKIIIDDAVTRKSLLQELHNISAKADADDVVLIYLSGHGLDGAYVPSDFDGYKNQVSYEDILETLDNSAAKHKLFITDACHSGSMLATARTPYNVALENFYTAYSSIEGGTAIMMSSKKEEVSLEYGGLRQGVFSHFLIKGLKGQADLDSDKLITISELYNYVSTNVKSYTANAQNPAIMGDFDKDMPVGWVRQF